MEDALNNKSSSVEHATSNSKKKNAKKKAKKKNSSSSSNGNSQKSITNDQMYDDISTGESLLSDDTAASSIYDKNMKKNDPTNNLFYFPEPAGDGTLYVYDAGIGLQVSLNKCVIIDKLIDMIESTLFHSFFGIITSIRHIGWGCLRWI
jgi:hypothetical protein